jgi:hypothetical protein
MLGGTADSRAYELYMSARAQLNGVGRGGNDRQRVETSLEQIKSALRRDRKFALAWVLKSKAHDAAQIYFPEDVAYHRRRADKASKRARALEPTLPEAHLELAFKAVRRMQWTKAEQEFAQASGDEMGQYAYLLVNTGHIKRAHDLFLVSRASDPRNANLFLSLMVTHDILGDTDGALDLYDQGEALFKNWPAGHFNALVVLWGRRRRADAKKARSLAKRIPGPVFDAVNRLYGSSPAALNELKRLFADKRYANPINQMAIAACAAHFGNAELALEALVAACVGTPLYSHKFWQPLFNDVRKRPGFEKFKRKHGFVDYWKRYGQPD